MKEYIVPRSTATTSISCTTAPALFACAPCQIHFETDDSSYERLSKGTPTSEIGLENFNSVSGPVYIEGAQPGDSIVIDIISIEISRVWCVWEDDPEACGVLAAHAKGENHVFEMDIVDGKVVVSERLQLPLDPMIGCLSLAPPPESSPSSTMEPVYPWGGNMDLREMRPGTSVWLPVQCPGGLLYVGDLHGNMGQGEPVWVGLEAAGVATIQASVVKGMAISAPQLRMGNETLFLGLDETHTEAMSAALARAYDYLVTVKGLSRLEAFVYCSAKVDARLGGPAHGLVLLAVPDPEEFMDSK